MNKLNLSALLLLVLCSGCASTEQDLSGAGAAKRGLATEQVGWTNDFMRKRLLIADEIRVVGPQGLRAHLATRFDPALIQRKEKTVPEGYLQVFRLQPGNEGEIACYLDKFELHATRKLTVLERPGPFDIVVEGVGDVYYVDIDSQQEQRLPSIRIEGKIER